MVAWGFDSGSWIGISNFEWEAIAEDLVCFAIDLIQSKVVASIAVRPLECDDESSNYADEDARFYIPAHIFFISNAGVEPNSRSPMAEGRGRRELGSNALFGYLFSSTGEAARSVCRCKGRSQDKMPGRSRPVKAAREKS